MTTVVYTTILGTISDALQEYETRFPGMSSQRCLEEIIDTVCVYGGITERISKALIERDVSPKDKMVGIRWFYSHYRYITLERITSYRNLKGCPDSHRETLQDL